MIAFAPIDLILGSNAFTTLATDLASNESSFTKMITRIDRLDAEPPEILDIVINDGNIQRLFVVVDITFSENVAGSLSREDFTLVRDGSEPFNLTEDALTYDLTTHTARLDLHVDDIPTGDYVLTVIADQITDAGGNALTQDGSAAFHKLCGHPTAAVG